jgi:hypothetical protein
MYNHQQSQINKIHSCSTYQLGTTMSIQDYTFHIDAISPEVITGWAIKNDDINANPVIEAYSGETLLWSTSASEPRDDLHQAGYGDAAFVIIPNAASLPHNIDAIDLFIDGHKATEQAAALVLHAPSADEYTCHVDSAENNTILGWSQLGVAPQHRVEMQVRVDSEVVAQSTANEFRADLAEAGIGDGEHAFTLNIDIAKLPVATGTYHLFVDGKVANVAPIPFSVDQKDIEQAKFYASFAEEIGDFNAMVGAEQARIEQQIEAATSDFEQASLNTVANIAINNIAQLGARMSVIEQMLVKHLNNK